MKNKDLYYALIAASVLGIISQTFELFSELINSILITGSIGLLTVIYITDLICVKKEIQKKNSYKFWKYFNLVSQNDAPSKISSYSTPYGTTYRYIPPIGVSSAKFNSKYLELKEYTKADDVDIKYDKGEIVIDLFHAKDADIEELI